MSIARKQIEALFASQDFCNRLRHTALLDFGCEDAEELVQQLQLEALRAADRQLELAAPEAFAWACYKRCKRDALRMLERRRKREGR